LENGYSGEKSGVWEISKPLMKFVSNVSPKSTLLHQIALFQPSTVLIGWRVWAAKVKKKESTKATTSPYWARQNPQSDDDEFCTLIRYQDGHQLCTILFR
jgi:hypothetical protein